MSISQMLGQSGILTVLGMGVVFSFLIILILSMKLLHAVLHALRLDKDEKPAAAPEASSAGRTAVPPQAADTGAIVAAIAAAVRERQ